MNSIKNIEFPINSYSKIKNIITCILYIRGVSTIQIVLPLLEL